MTTYTNPGAIGDVHDSADVEGSWMNAIRDRVCNTFADALARDTFYASVGGAVPGQFCYLRSTGAFMQYCGAATGWRPPWNTAWGLVAGPGIDTTNRDTSGVTGFVELTGTSVTFTAVANRYYRIVWSGQMSIATAVTWGEVMLAEPADPFVPVERALISFPATGKSQAVRGVHVLTLAAGPKTYSLEGRTGDTTRVVTVRSAERRASLEVYDIGPAGDPV
jgi:hypothetical protein